MGVLIQSRTLGRLLQFDCMCLFEMGVKKGVMYFSLEITYKKFLMHGKIFKKFDYKDCKIKLFHTQSCGFKKYRRKIELRFHRKTNLMKELKIHSLKNL